MPKRKNTLAKLREPKSPALPRCDVFWDISAFWITPSSGGDRTGPFVTLHAACVAAIEAGFEIATVRGTRGGHPGLK